MNLFVISNLGQLYQMQSLIKKMGCRQNKLAILYTNRNLEIKYTIENNIDYVLFSEIENVLLPDFPLNKKREIQEQIRETYRVLLDNFQGNTVYVCSYEHHYNLLYNEAKKRSLKVNLVEEGTATYKLLVKKENAISRMAMITNAIRKLLRDLSNSIIIFTSSLLTEKEKKHIRRLLLPKDLKCTMDHIKEFDEVFVSFPDKAKILFKAQNYYDLTPDYQLNNEMRNQLNKNKVLNKINDKSIVFVNQKYNVPVQEHVRIILKILESNFDGDNIFIKLHPKDSNIMKETFETYARASSKQIIVLSLDIEVPFESILKEKQPKAVVGLTSSSLAYTKKITSKTQVVSCMHTYLEEISKLKSVSEKEIQVISYHGDILRKITEVETI